MASTSHHTKQKLKYVKIVGKAINQYSMIQADDNILIALSGGKDSMVLVDVLYHRLSYLPISYNLFCCHIYITNFSQEQNIEHLHRFCAFYNIPLIIKEITIDFDREHSSPCFVCSWFRRKTLFETAAMLNCKKIAFGHTQDDIIITFFMNMLYHGKLSTMPPKLTMFNGTLEIIRPLAFLTESQVIGYAKMLPSIPMEYGCPFKDSTKRQQTKQLLKYLNKTVQHAQSNIFRSLKHRDDNYLL